MLSLLKYIAIPVKFKRFYFAYKDREFNLLDVGCGYHSAPKTMKYFKSCNYYGIDRDAIDNDEVAFKLMRKFFRIDLDKDTLDDIPDDFFDVILVSHVLEHLHNGIKVVSDLAMKLKPNGVIYIEYPGLRSLSTPTNANARKACLHFCDDQTHIKMYMMHEIVNALLDENIRIIKAGTRRDKIRLVLTPMIIARGIMKRDILSRGLWDLLGFAEYVFARKPYPDQV